MQILWEAACQFCCCAWFAYGENPPSECIVCHSTRIIVDESSKLRKEMNAHVNNTSSRPIN